MIQHIDNMDSFKQLSSNGMLKSAIQRLLTIVIDRVVDQKSIEFISRLRLNLFFQRLTRSKVF